MHELGPGDSLPRDFLPTGGFPYASRVLPIRFLDCAQGPCLKGRFSCDPLKKAWRTWATAERHGEPSRHDLAR